MARFRYRSDNVVGRLWEGEIVTGLEDRGDWQLSSEKGIWGGHTSGMHCMHPKDEGCVSRPVRSCMVYVCKEAAVSTCSSTVCSMQPIENLCVYWFTTFDSRSNH